ncbi:16S rRNA (guanine(527)-N(7))-methyltransferase RsmG [Sulfitobacter sp. F26169L]|uniref:16S rRNA (guanine(527)-N(7))-methyltransferase RsmG n=1 Tax=Sulfitobacter sp. F26169L TaxID=2996015 RepID=UPI002260BE36|nr:16S rRNA (guanine(527)-N(7))-methyltransferase RsmG [Sulfitobacter sp. F26169L]MCX7565894.1 16S rRNA (guanine(527)-N(7))-methyltransferase RsmG [Sulfitobacter sp. F26169L]
MASALLDNVSRETMERLRALEALVQKWTKKINLVSGKDALQVWDRHIVDSIQIFNLAPEGGSWLDIGSGGGFPGIVVAILAKETDPDRTFSLVDSDQRKCAFLRTAARELDLNVNVIAARVEEIEPLNAQVLSARALSDLPMLLEFAERHLSKSGMAVFPKGSSWQKEHEAAQKTWSYKLEVVRSMTNSDATILKIEELKRV